MHSKSTNTAMI